MAKRVAEENIYLEADLIVGQNFYERQIEVIDKCLCETISSACSARKKTGVAADLIKKRKEFICVSL